MASDSVDPIFKIRDNETGKVIKFQWHDRENQPTQEDFAQIFEAAKRMPMAGPLGEAGRARDYNPAGSGTEEFSTASAAMRLPKQWADTALTGVGEMAYPASLAMMGDLEGARAADNRAAETSDLSVDSMGGVSAPPVEETVNRNIPGMAPAAGRIALGPIAGLLANDDQARAIGTPIVKMGVGTVSDPTTYVPFHKGMAVVRKGAAAIFGYQGMKAGLLATGKAYEQVRTGDYTGAMASLTEAGLSGAMAALMFSQLKGGASPKQAIETVGNQQSVTDTGTPGPADIPENMSPGQRSGSYSGTVPAPGPPTFPSSGSGTPGQADIPNVSIGRAKPAPPAPANGSGVPGQAIMPQNPYQMRVPPPGEAAPPAETQGPHRTAEDLYAQVRQGVPPGDYPGNAPPTGDVEAEYARARAEGKPAHVDGKRGKRIKQSPYTMRDLQAHDPQYDNAPPVVGSPEWMDEHVGGIPMQREAVHVAEPTPEAPPPAPERPAPPVEEAAPPPPRAKAVRTPRPAAPAKKGELFPYHEDPEVNAAIHESFGPIAEALEKSQAEHTGLIETGENSGDFKRYGRVNQVRAEYGLENVPKSAKEIAARLRSKGDNVMKRLIAKHLTPQIEDYLDGRAKDSGTMRAPNAEMRSKGKFNSAPMGMPEARVPGAKGNVPIQGSLFPKGEMLQPSASNVTEGRESNGPLFTQEADAQVKADAAKQQTLGPDDPEYWHGQRGALAIGPSKQRIAAQNKRLSKQTTTEGFFNMLIEGRRNELLSAPTTYVKQGVDLASQAEAPGLKAISAGLEQSGISQRIEHGIQKWYGKPNPRLRTSVERHFDELPEHFKALVESVDGSPNIPQNALARAKDVLMGKAYQLAPHLDPHAIPGKIGSVIRTPQRIVGSIDTIMKELTSGTEQASYAVREVKRRGLSGALAQSEVRRIRATRFENLPEAAQKEIFAKVQEKTLTQSLGSWGKTLNALRERPAMKFLFPFMQVGSNIVKQTYQRTPFYLGEIIHKVGTGELKGGLVADELAKPIMGAILGSAFLTLAHNGSLTGSGPTSKAQQYNKQAGGWQPYSVHAYGQYVSYDAIGHIGSIMGLAADYEEAKDLKTKKEVAQKLYNSLLTNLTPRTIQDMGTLFELAKGWRDGQFERNATRFVGTTLSGALVPRIVSKAAAAMDSDAQGRGISRKVESVGDYIMRDIPGQRERLPVLRSSTGAPVLRDSTAAERFLLPFPRTSDKPERIAEKEFERLNWLPKGTTKTTDVRTRMGNETVDLTPQERELLLDANTRATKIAERVMKSPTYTHLSDRPLIQKEIIARIYEQQRRAVLGRMQRDLRGRAPSTHPQEEEN